MARILTEFWGGQHKRRWSNIFHGGAISTTPPTGGGGSSKALLQTAGDCQDRFTNSALLTEAYGAIWFNLASFSTASLLNHVLSFWRAGVQLCEFRINGSNKFEARRGTGTGTLLGTGSAVLVPSTWYNLQWHFKPNIATGIFESKIDNVADITLNAINTAPNSETDFDQIEIDTPNGGAYYQVIIINDTTGGADNSWPGIRGIKDVICVGNSATNNAWTKSSGSSAFALLSELPPDDDTTYISSTVLAQKQGLTFAAHGLPANTIVKSVIDEHLCRKVTDGQIKLGIRSATVESEDATIDISAGSYLPYQVRRTTDPNTSAAWTLTNVNSAESLIESVV